MARHEEYGYRTIEVTRTGQVLRLVLDHPQSDLNAVDGRRVIIDGVKRRCTGADFADYIYCLARSDDEAPRHRNLSFVLIAPDADGVTIHPMDHVKLRYTLSSDVILDAVELPIESVVGGEAGWNRILQELPRSHRPGGRSWTASSAAKSATAFTMR